MKILDRYLLKSFLVTFATVFVILFFIFVLQVVWLFISELAGKDLDVLMVLKFLLFKMPSIIPLVLPLSVLLASIMTFGSLAENYEFAAMKSSGISLQRAMRPLIYFIIILSLVAFAFANNVIPYAEYKFVNFRRNIAQRTPAMAIAEGQFSQVGSYSIKVEKKSGDNGRFLKGVTIHQIASDGTGSHTVIKAKSGELISSESSNILKLVLKDGNYYEDIIPKKFEERNKVPFAKSEFQRYVINIDLSKLNSANLDEAQITSTNTMLTVGELTFTLDSLQKNYNKDLVSIAENITQRASITPMNNGSYTAAKPLNKEDLLRGFSDIDKNQILRIASGNVDATNFSIESSNYELDDKLKNISGHWIALYDKFVIAFSCLLMFFIGAPLGAIIRKGGLGLPIVFAIMIFIVFHFINTFGKKVAQEDEITPLLGSWMSSFVLAPLAILLTKKATDDKGFAISFDWLTNFFSRLMPSKDDEEKQLVTVPTQGHFDLKEDVKKIEKKVAKKPRRISATKDLASIETLTARYKQLSLFSIIIYIALMAALVSGWIEGGVLMMVGTGLAAVFFLLLYLAQQALEDITYQSDKPLDVHTFIILLGAVPFYPLFYLYNRVYLKEILSENNTTTV